MNDPGRPWETDQAVSIGTAGDEVITAQPAPVLPLAGVWSQVVAMLGGLGVLGAGFYALNRSGWADRVGTWVTDLGGLAYVLFPVFYATCNVLLLPAGVLGVGAGYMFGLWPGFFLVLAGNVLGAAVAFGISRLFLRQLVTGWVQRHPKYAAFDRAIGREGWKIVFLTQLNPLAPTSLLNYLYGVTRLSFGQTMLWIAIGQAPGLFLYAYLGWVGQGPWAKVLAASPADNAAASGGLGPAGGAWFWAGGLILTLLLTLYLRTFAQRVLKESLETE